MFVCIDAHYFAARSAVAGVVFRDIQSDVVEREYVRETAEVEPYHSGHFYKRELPGIQALLRKINFAIHTVIIDGYVWLSSDLKPGLGAHLFRSLGSEIPVIGVAKSPYRDVSMAVKVYRGDSSRPLFVSAAGMEKVQAARLIRQMHGRHRLPTLLKQADTLSRKPALKFSLDDTR
ncbi:MAG TPA: endonuclease V [Desulfobacteraceae bacterium]|nr:endonuclease V [Desulfobacteraceae bacterium]